MWYNPGMTDADRNHRSAGAKAVVLADLHCHSDASDGSYTPARIAAMLAEAGVSYASLTDHHSLAGLMAFHRAASKRGITDIAGVEISAIFDDAEIHLLAYGFDPESRVLHKLFDGNHDAYQAISSIHEAGGIVFLAHPLQTGWSGDVLEAQMERLVDAGLDGIEAYYKPYAPEVREELAELAEKLNIMTCGGSDYHSPNGTETASLGIEFPADQWKRFSRALSEHAKNALHTRALAKERQEARIEMNWRWLVTRIVLPSFFVIAFFISLIFGMIIPTMEERLMERKREMTTELTNSAWSILSDYEREVREGKISIEEAQQAAVERIRRIRYGPEGMNYFWITDMHPRMVMHPYREDLEGSDLSDFTDPEGVRPFVEFVSAVRKQSSGYVRYVWQWHDDPERLEAKESYVRGFAPWGWIIGTGLYVEDVRQEIDGITRRMVDLSFAVVVVAAMLLLTIAYQSLKIERRRSEAEQDLHRSHERYRTLVESAASGVLLLSGPRCAYANRKLLDMLGYRSPELAFLDIDDILVGSDDTSARSALARIEKGEEIIEPVEARLRRKDGRTVPILISSTQVTFAGNDGMLLSIQDITRHRTMQSEAERDRLFAQLQASQLFLTEPVRNSMEAPVSCDLNDTIAKAVSLMGKHGTDAITILGGEGELVGIITDHDIRERVVAGKLDTALPVSRIMSAPVVSISEDAPVFEAFLLERERQVEHLAVTDDAGHLTGMIRSSRTVRPERYSLVVLIQQFRRSRTVDELASCHERIPSLISSLVESGALPRHVCHVLTGAFDAAACQVISLMIQELGSPPLPFAFVALGSEARKEQTLATDQDNAIIYSDSPDTPGAREYFLKLGRLICDALHQLGYRYCRGGNMAKHEEWNQPLSQWKEYFSQWIAEPDSRALASCNVFFDHRCIFGDFSLVQELRGHISREIAAHPAFLSHMARNTLRYKPPVGLFGKIVTGTAGEAPNMFNVKEAMLPIVNFARLYALKHQIDETNTFDRLMHLRDSGMLQEESWRGITQAYSHLMQLRFRRQLEMIMGAMDPDNSVNPDTLTQIDHGMLKHSFSQITVIQKKVSLEFQGTV